MDEDDDPTDEQRAAYEKLNEAIAEYHGAYHEAGLVMDWVLVTQLTDPLADGRDAHSTSYIGSSSQPQYRALGLLEYGATVIRKRIADSVF